MTFSRHRTAWLRNDPYKNVPGVLRGVMKIGDEYKGGI